MKHLALFFCLCCVFSSAQAQTVRSNTLLPLLQVPRRTAAQTQQVLQLFLTSKDSNTIFSAGASLVRIPPSSGQEVKLINALLKENNALRKIFAAIILTAMGSHYEELLPLLEQGISSQDPALRAYAASAYTILNPHSTHYLPYVVNLYIYDADFAQRALNLAASTEKDAFTFLKQASASKDPQIRGAAAQWLGDLHTHAAAKQLLKMAKHETVAENTTTLAVALAKNHLWTLTDVVKGLKNAPKSHISATYALALGFMTGYAVEAIKQALSNPHTNIRINAARAAAYMAGVLNSPQASSYTQDKDFDSSLLKGLIPLLSHLAATDKTVKPYAAHALQQIAKLK